MYDHTRDCECHDCLEIRSLYDRLSLGLVLGTILIICLLTAIFNVF